MMTDAEPPRRRAGRPAQISRPQVIDAAVRIGLDQLSMGALAADLGVTHSTIYNHIANRDELLALVTDRIFAQAPWPKAGTAQTWRDDAIELAVCLWGVLQRNPGLSTELARRHTTPIAFDELCPHYWDTIRSLRSIIAQGGFAPIDVIALADIVLEVSYTHGGSGWRSADHDPSTLRGVDGDLVRGLADSLSMPPEHMLRRKLCLILRA